MQSKKIIILSAIGCLLGLLPAVVTAQSRHLNQTDLKNETTITAEDAAFSLIIPENKYTYLDAYLFTEASTAPEEFSFQSPVYSYYLYSEEVKPDDTFLVSLKLNEDSLYGQSAYYWQADKNRWAKASTVNQSKNNLVIRLAGKSNKFFLSAPSAPFVSAEQFFSYAGLTLNLPQILANQETQTTITEIPIVANPAKKPISNAYRINIALKNSDLSAYLEEIKTNPHCSDYLTGYLSSSKANSSAAVAKLQKFLREQENFSYVQSTGKYDKITSSAVKEFQERYKTDILDPWDLTEGNGQVYKTTFKKINQLYCQTSKKNQTLLNLSYNYDWNSNKAKTIYYLKETKESGEWLPLESFNNHKTTTVNATTDQQSLTVAVFEEENQWVGEASWYAYKGGNFAASRDFPKGTKIKVINQLAGANQGKTVIITVNDYGPEVWTKRIIDLDKKAYEQIGNLNGGVMPVKIEIVK